MSNKTAENADEGFLPRVGKFLYGGFQFFFFGAVIFCALALAVYGLRFLMFESSYDRLAPVMQNAPAWYQDLAKDVIDHESMVAGGINSLEDRGAAFWALDEVGRKRPEDLGMPDAWLEKTANTPDLTHSQLAFLRKLGEGKPSVSTTDAASWLLVVERDLRNNQSDGWQAIDRRLEQGFSSPN